VAPELTEEELRLLIVVFSALRREYEQYRKDNHHMESARQFNARMLEDDLVRRGYDIGVN
jgi:hypothetical protein